jgi:putative DNA primase/helicase
MKPNFEQINQSALACLESLKVNLTKGVWKDFASDAGGGDPISLLAAIRSISQGDAARELASRLAIQAPAPATKGDWQPIIAPASAPAPTFRHHKHGEPAKVWRYPNADGDTIGYIARYNTPTGKEILPRTYCQQGDRREWRWTAFGKPRPLCGLDLLAADPKAGVLIVEGEKAADAARAICPGVVVTWPGGANAVRYVDWKPLKGRKVLIWPDQDLKRFTPEDDDKHRIPDGYSVGDLKPDHEQPGIHAALAIKAALQGVAASVKIIRPPASEMDGWDLADAVDEGWDSARLIAWIKSAPFISEPAPEPPPGYDAPAMPEPDQPRFHEDRISDLPFRLLGVHGDEFFYMPDRGQQIVALTASAHSKNNLMRLAALNCWEEAFPGGSGPKWDDAVNALIQRSQSMPKFDASRVRGRGCWIDGEDIVYHAGDVLVVNGDPTQIYRYQSRIRAIYESDISIPFDSGRMAAPREAGKLIELCKMLSFERPLYGTLLAGWLALAPVCGVLRWRPHVWITGPSGAGKTWIFSDIVTPMIGESGKNVAASTSEAGIRHDLGCDALPVVFDEAESRNKSGQIRMENVLELARQASSETGARIMKGSAGGKAMSYLIRSCFLFSSIGVAAVESADASRVTVLTLQKNTGPFAEKEFEAIQALAGETTHDPEFCGRVRARSLSLAKIIRANAATFSMAAVEFVGSKRFGDQFGALLAGAYSLTSGKAISREDAREWMAKQDWTGFRADDTEDDQSQCFAHLFSAILRYEDQGRGMSRSIDEIIREIRSIPDHAADSELGRRRELKDVLIRHGLRLSDGRLYVANRHAQLERVFADTPWAGAKWRQQLERMPGGMKHEVTSFGANVRQRAVSVSVG